MCARAGLKKRAENGITRELLLLLLLFSSRVGICAGLLLIKERRRLSLTGENVVDDQVSDSDASGSNGASSGGASDANDGAAYVHKR